MSAESAESARPEAAVEQPLVPLEILDHTIGSGVRILRTSKEFVGKLVGFDDFVNMVLENVVEICDGKESAPIKKMLLNGTLITMISPI